MYHEEGELRNTVRIRGGEPLPRPARQRPPCRTKVGCDKGTPERSIINERTMRAYQHYLECSAVGSFPDDPVVRRNAGIIRGIEQRVESMKHDELRAALAVNTARANVAALHGR